MSETKTKTLQYGACTINIYRPELTEQERERRGQQAMETIGRVMSGYIKKRKEKTV